MKTKDWRPIPEFPGYEVHKTGKVRSLPRPITRNGKTIRLRHECSLRPSMTSNGFRQVVLSHAGRRKSFRVHDLVCRVFHGERPPGEQAIFKNGNRQDLRATNLTWGKPDPTKRIFEAMSKLADKLPPDLPLPRLPAAAMSSQENV
jgi:NUMOD4 motif/HNH endonuclease